MVMIPLMFIGIGIYTLFHRPFSYASTNSEERLLVHHPSLEAYFSPDEDIQSMIVKLIRSETKSIWCAAFRLTDKIIAGELLDAMKRGIKLTLVVDREGFSATQSKLLHLFKEGVPIYIFPPLSQNELKDGGVVTKDRFGSQPLMHNKFMLFHGQNTLLTGSYNFTKSAQSQNQENVLIVRNNTSVFNQYCNQFKIICTRSTLFSTKQEHIVHVQ